MVLWEEVQGIAMAIIVLSVDVHFEQKLTEGTKD